MDERVGVGGSRRVVFGDGLPAPGSKTAPQTAYWSTSRFKPPSPAPGKAVAGGKKEVKALTVWVTWRELEGKSTQPVSISPFPTSSHFLRVYCIPDTVIGSHLILTTAL